MPTPFRIPFPIKGINRNYARSDQNGQQQGYLSQFLPETCWAALNVLPYDRFDRLRGGQRPGIVKLSTTQMAASAVQGLLGTAVEINTAAINPNTPLLVDTMHYTTGSNLTTRNVAYTGTDANSAQATPDLIFNDTAGDTSTTTPGTSVTFLSNATTDSQAYRYTTNLSQGSTYTVSASINGITGGSAITNTFIYGVATRLGSGANPGTGAIFLWFQPCSTTQAGALTIYQGSTSLASFVIPQNTAALLKGNAHVVTLSVVGNNFYGLVDGVQYVTTASTSNAANVQIGFFGESVTATMTITNFSVTGANVVPVNRAPLIMAVCAGNVWQATEPTQGSFTLTKTSNQTNPVFNSAGPVSLTTQNAQLYGVDGFTIGQVDLATNTAVAYAATAGTAPTNTTICTTWRGRLVLAGNTAAPQNFYMSRVGTPTDWDYSQTDGAQAFEGSAATAGYIGEPIRSLMPFNDDVLLIGGDHNLWRVQGDPAQGGSIDLVSDSIGVLGPNAWTKDDTGTIWFLGTGGLYSISPGGQPMNVSAQSTGYDFGLRGIDSTANYISLSFNVFLHGFDIFITPVDGITQGTHFWYDKRNGGTWPLQFPVVQGPTASTIFIGDSSVDFFQVIGGFDGRLRYLSILALDDDGTAIVSDLWLGPFQPNTPTGDSVLTGLDVTTGENYTTDSTSVFNLTWTLNGGKTAFEVTEGTPRTTVGGQFTFPGWQATQVQRIRGGWFTLVLTNATIGTYWSMEHAVMHVEAQGKQR